MLLGSNDAACYEVAKLAKRIKIALNRFEQTAIMSVAACRIANMNDGDGIQMDSRTWHLVRSAHTTPALAATRIASLYRIADKMKQDQPKEEQQCP